jgi:hypothetical protein
MGFPIGWTDLEPLAWPKYQNWLDAHSSRDAADSPSVLSA